MYKEGTKIQSVRVHNDAYRRMIQAGIKVGRVVNEGLSRLRHDWEFEKVEKSTQRSLTISWLSAPYPHEENTMATKIRIRRDHVEWMEINSIIKSRAIMFVIYQYVKNNL